MGVNGPNQPNKAEIINNMQAHYQNLLTENYRDFGNDDISASIFKKLDTNGNFKLDSSEILDANNTLKDVITSVAEKFYESASKLFGKNYTEQLKDAEKNKNIQNKQSETKSDNKLNNSEKVILQNVEEAKAKIIEYAKQHPEDNRIQQIAQEIGKLVNNTTTSKDGDYVAVTYPDENRIVFNAKETENLDPDIALKNLIHEAAHYINGDDLSSQREEVDVESYAIDVAESITKKTLYEDKEAHLDEFGKRYKTNSNTGKSSPGYDGIPLNAGFVINEDITGTTQDGNKTTISSNFIDWKQEHQVVMGTEKDPNGNPYPIEASRTIETDDGRILKWEYSNYDKARKVWQEEKFIE